MSASPFYLTVTVLGSGTSQGVPMIGCKCDVCRSPDPHDKRTRSSLFLVTPDIHILLDTTPDLRQQALREDLDRVDAVLFTHAHADHVMGFDDLRRFCDRGAMPVYGSAQTLKQIEQIFYYAFVPNRAVPGYVHVAPHLLEAPFELGGLEITPLPLPHGSLTTTGYLFSHQGRKWFAYLNDCKQVPEEVRAIVRGVEVLLIDGLRDRPHPTHLSVSDAVETAKAIGARQTYLTHQADDRRHADRSRDLPEGVAVAYDGMKLEFAVG